MLLWEWLLRTANKMNIRGGSAFHAMAGFGRHHVLHEDRFFELGGSLIVEVEFIVTPEEKRKLLDLVAAEKIRLFYADIPARFGCPILNSAIGARTASSQEGRGRPHNFARRPA
jgi:hypothetical protein